MDPNTGDRRVQLIRPAERTIDQMPDGVVASNLGFVFATGRRYSYGEFQYILDIAKMLHSAGRWGIGDALIEAQRQLGEDFSQLLDDIDYDPGTLQNMMSVCRAFPIGQRVLGLSPSFHMVVSPIARGGPDGPEMARAWLKDAAEHGWTREQLTREVRQSLLPPSMRDEMVAPVIVADPGDDGESLSPRPRPLYSTAEFVSAVDQLIAAARSAGVANEAIEPALRIVRYYRYGGSLLP